MAKVDLPSLLMVLAFMANLAIGFFDPFKMPVPKEIGLALLVVGSLFFVYVLFYLRSGFFGETEPRLDFLITEGPYRVCRHPQYLSFVIMILGFDLMFRSILGVVFTLALSIPSMVYRARIEDRLLKSKFGKEWEEYAKKVGFLFPKLRRSDWDRFCFHSKRVQSRLAPDRFRKSVFQGDEMRFLVRL